MAYGPLTHLQWIQLVKLFLSSNQYVADVQRELTGEWSRARWLTRHTYPYIFSLDSILILFGSYPGEPTLGRYLRIAIEQQVLSIPTFVTTFLQASRSATFHSPATLDILCKVVLDAHDASDPPALRPILSTKIFPTIHDAVVLLKTAYTFPASSFHKLTASASELLTLLISCASDFSQLTTGQAMNYWNDITELQQMPLEPHVRQVLDNFTFSLSLVLGDDAKINREAQMMHSIQMSLGNKTDSLAPASEYETTTFCLLFDNLVRSAASYGFQCD
jgi:mediator of RNA polymerase II transcription subunit 5